MTRVARLASELEQNLRASRPGDPLPARERLREALSRVLQGLAAADWPGAHHHPSCDSKQLNPQCVEALLGQLAQKLADHDFEPTTDFDTLKEQLPEGDWTPHLRTLQADLDALDFAEAQHSLQRMQESLFGRSALPVWPGLLLRVPHVGYKHKVFGIPFSLDPGSSPCHYRADCHLTTRRLDLTT